MLFYIFFLVVLGIPILTMEFSVGRASRRSAVKACQQLEKPGQKWHLHGIIAVAGNYLLMMFYTVVTGWMLHYFYLTASGRFVGSTTEEVEGIFNSMNASPGTLTFWMVIVVAVGFLICSMGLKNGVERITKWMMLALLAIMVILAVRSISLPGAAEGLEFYLKPDAGKLQEVGVGQRHGGGYESVLLHPEPGHRSHGYFSAAIWKRKEPCMGESVTVAALDTFVAITSGLIIFPACFAYGVNPDSGPNLIFITLPNIFTHMPGGRVWGSLFFVFMAFAAFSTIIAVV